MMWANRRRENGYDNWRALQKKLADFGFADLSHHVSPLLNRDRQMSLALKSKLKQQMIEPVPMRPVDVQTPMSPLYRLRSHPSNTSRVAITHHSPSSSSFDTLNRSTTSLMHEQDRMQWFAKYGASDWIIGLHGIDRDRQIAELYGKSLN